MTNLARLLNHGTLAGTGKMVILPVDQGFEHGPARSFAAEPGGLRSRCTTMQLAIDSGCNAYAAPLGFLEAVAGKFAGEIPLILKLNNSDVAAREGPALGGHRLGEGRRAPRLRGDRLHHLPGLRPRNEQYEDLREIIAEAQDAGLPPSSGPTRAARPLARRARRPSTWSPTRRRSAAQLGAHVIKVKPPKDHIEQAEAKKVFEKYNIPTKTLADRVRHVVQSAFNGKRIVIFSGGEAKGHDPGPARGDRQIRDGGGFGSIMGRNAFQRKREHALSFLGTVMKIYSGSQKARPWLSSRPRRRSRTTCAPCPTGGAGGRMMSGHGEPDHAGQARRRRATRRGRGERESARVPSPPTSPPTPPCRRCASWWIRWWP